MPAARLAQTEQQLQGLPRPSARRSAQYVLEEILDEPTRRAVLRVGVKLALGQRVQADQPPNREWLKMLWDRILGPVPREPVDSNPLIAVGDHQIERLSALLSLEEPPLAGSLAATDK
jgi:hypothetical protein